jgi:hypothetical protein
VTTPAILAYVPGRVPQMSGQIIIPDFANNRVYSIGEGNIGNPPPLGISQFTAYVSGDLTLARTIAEIGMSDIGDDPAVLTQGGVIIVPEHLTGRIAAIRAADLTLLNIKASMPQPGTMAAVRYKGRDYVLGCPGYSIPDYNKVYVMNAFDLTASYISSLVETGHPSLCKGSSTDATRVGFVMGQGSTISDPTNPNRFGLYKVGANGGFSVTNIMHGVPTTIDATWSTFSDIQGLAYDQTDGNLMLTVGTFDAVANPSYLCKFNSTTGALMWKLAVVSSTVVSGLSLQAASIKNGRFHFWNLPAGGGPGDRHCISINTLTGAVIADTTVDHMLSVGGQVSEDTNDSITALASWSEGTTVPNYLGTYMGTLGNHIYGGWMRWFPFGPTAPLPPAPPPVPSTPPVVSVNRAWTYTLDGHTFYVLDLGAQGTFVYDEVTKEWSNFVTGTPATAGGPNLQWNMQNGCMWGTRIVGADLATPNIWEQAPGAVLDNDAAQIAHVVTGGVSARGRDYSTCDAVRVTASFGFEDSSGAVAFNLRFSDDLEHTWSPTFVVTLNPADYGGEISWRSLGSFASPGRIFELSDAGGLIRIDGADVYLDGFDEVPEPGGG